MNGFGWKGWVLAVAIFAAGTVFGGAFALFTARQMVQQSIRDPDQVRLRIGNRLARQLNLNDGQRAQVDKILFQAHSEIKSLRAQSQPKFVAILDRTEKEIDAVLTPEQREKFEKVVAERKKFWGVP